MKQNGNFEAHKRLVVISNASRDLTVAEWRVAVDSIFMQRGAQDGQQIGDRFIPYIYNTFLLRV